jgi:hypothetical protein
MWQGTGDCRQVDQTCPGSDEGGGVFDGDVDTAMAW